MRRVRDGYVSSRRLLHDRHISRAGTRQGGWLAPGRPAEAACHILGHIMAFILRRLRRDETGAAAIEYSLIVALVALVAWMAGAHLVEASVSRTGERLNSAMAGAGKGGG